MSNGDVHYISFIVEHQSSDQQSPINHSDKENLQRKESII